MSATTPRMEQSHSWSQRRSVAPPSSATRGAAAAIGGDHASTSRPAGHTAPGDGVNPYTGHRQLRPREQEVLGEYAKLAATIKRVETLSTDIASSERHATMLRDLRILERKMGLVLTLFKASVWSLIQTHQDELEQQQVQEHDEQHGAYEQTAYGEGPEDSFERQQDVDEQEYTMRPQGIDTAPMPIDRSAAGRGAYRPSHSARTPPTRHSNFRA